MKLHIAKHAMIVALSTLICPDQTIAALEQLSVVLVLAFDVSLLAGY